MTTLRYKKILHYEQKRINATQKALIGLLAREYEAVGVTLKETRGFEHPYLAIHFDEVGGTEHHVVFCHDDGELEDCEPQVVADIVTGRRTWYQASVVDATTDRTSAIGKIADVVSNTLVPLYDRMIQDWDYERTSKVTKPGAYECFEDYWESDQAYDEHHDLCDDFTNPEDPYRLEVEREWNGAKARWTKESESTQKEINEIVEALESLAQEWEIPFSAEVVKAQARNFAESHPQWNTSKCW